MDIHELKTWPEFFEATLSGQKKFEVRKDDRNFFEGDVLVLREWKPDGESYTGRMMAVKVAYFLKGELGLPEDLCVMGIERI